VVEHLLAKEGVASSNLVFRSSLAISETAEAVSLFVSSLMALQSGISQTPDKRYLRIRTLISSGISSNMI
jgi:hypothetical protein